MEVNLELAEALCDKTRKNYENQRPLIDNFIINKNVILNGLG